MDDNENKSNTTFKTLWSESILEVLYLALKYDKSDREVREILKLIMMKGKKPDYIIRKVYTKLGEEAATRVKLMLHQHGNENGNEG